MSCLCHRFYLLTLSTCLRKGEAEGTGASHPSPSHSSVTEKSQASNQSAKIEHMHAEESNSTGKFMWQSQVENEHKVKMILQCNFYGTCVMYKLQLLHVCDLIVLCLVISVIL